MEKIYNEELNDLYSSPNIIRVIKSRRMRLAGHIARFGERCIQGFDGEPRGNETTWRPRRRWEDVKMDLQGV
jgi:hypothetical protein